MTQTPAPLPPSLIFPMVLPGDDVWELAERERHGRHDSGMARRRDAGRMGHGEFYRPRHCR